MPKRELKYPQQIEDWLQLWGQQLSSPGKLILIGSGGLLWHAYQRNIQIPLPENSMDVDPITEDDAVAQLAYQALIGSEFELKNGWHINLMPRLALNELPTDWKTRAATKIYQSLTVIVPSPEDLLYPKIKRGEPRDLKHAQWAKEVGLIKP